MTDDARKLREILGNLAGHASLCWNPKPAGVFDSGEALQAVDTAIAALATFEREQIPREPTEAMTGHELKLLARCAQFVLAGEWPWEPERAGEREALALAADKILETYKRKRERKGPIVDRRKCTACGKPIVPWEQRCCCDAATAERARPEPCSRDATDADWEAGIGRGPELDQSDATPAKPAASIGRAGRDGNMTSGSASDPSQPAAGIVAEIQRHLSIGVPNESHEWNRQTMVLLQRARDEIANRILMERNLRSTMSSVSDEYDKRIAALEFQLAAQADRVPREPTTEMMLAGMAVQDENDGQDTAGVWRAMYDAAREGQT